MTMVNINVSDNHVDLRRLFAEQQGVAAATCTTVEEVADNESLLLLR
jgi:hypothetical protein